MDVVAMRLWVGERRHQKIEPLMEDENQDKEVKLINPPFICVIWKHCLEEHISTLNWDADDNL